jgi:hypothetical protein
MHSLSYFVVIALVAVSHLAAQGPPFATEARVTINQKKALDGKVTPGDDPGFPVLITQGGSYVLTSNLVVPTLNTGGILIKTSEAVTINLNGFSILGPNRCAKFYTGGCESQDSGSGIETDVATGSNTNFSTVYGGTVSGFGRYGVGMLGFGNTVRNMTITSCKFGLNVTGLIHDNVVTRNGDVGISTFGAVVRNNSVTENGGAGILMFRGTAMDNMSENNGGFGFWSPGGIPGYRGNSFAGNNGGGAQVSGGISLGPTTCEAALCP